jgi:hypothetical protein
MDDFISGRHEARGIGRIWTLRASEFRESVLVRTISISIHMSCLERVVDELKQGDGR